jgi:methionyl-tRNA formyltransferase
MRIVFFGTPDFAVPSLQALLGAGHDVRAVVTQPDRPQGRSRSTLIPPPVKLAAAGAGIPVLQPEKPAGDEFIATLRALDTDLAIVAAYGHLLRPAVLAIPRLGMVNVHASLLPRWRGAAPIQWAIRSGDSATGVTIMQMEAGLDSGPSWFARAIDIAPDDTAATLTERLSHLGALALLEALPRIAAGATQPLPQDSALVTLAPKVDRASARIDWNVPAGRVAAHIRAFDPAPGAWTLLGDSEVKLFGATSRTEPSGTPGTLASQGETLVIATGNGAVEVREVQVAGKRRQPVADWARGRPAPDGVVFR